MAGSGLLASPRGAMRTWKGLKRPPMVWQRGHFLRAPLLAHEDVDAGLAQAADALGTCIRVLQHGHALAGGAVDLHVLGRVARGRVGQAAGLHVEHVARSRRSRQTGRARGLLDVGRGGEGLLQGGTPGSCGRAAGEREAARRGGPRWAIGVPGRSGPACQGWGRRRPTGVLSSMSSVAEAAASIRSSQRLP